MSPIRSPDLPIMHVGGDHHVSHRPGLFLTAFLLKQDAQIPVSLRDVADTALAMFARTCGQWLVSVAPAGRVQVGGVVLGRLMLRDLDRNGRQCAFSSLVRWSW